MARKVTYAINAAFNFKILGFATGSYNCTCSDCKEQFIGDKRAFQCLECAIEQVESKFSTENTEIPKRPPGYDAALKQNGAGENISQQTNVSTMKELIEALEFYANPDTYFAIGFFPDPPCGDFINDFDETGKPGVLARKVLSNFSQKDVEANDSASIPKLLCDNCTGRQV